MNVKPAFTLRKPDPVVSSVAYFDWSEKLDTVAISNGSVPEVTIGSSRRSDIRLKSKYISRIHARIKVDGDSATIEDAGSTNGFLVNSVETRQHALTHADLLEIGDCKLRYVHATATQLPAAII
ncbi:MAG: FHA domain-containing protein [Gammaproteobacteria bacterium]|nr:FHA domain-containing protein [Gammaproteobacteria bacterium]MDH3372541.1 FHA domain-containing protein [Gammaproteobacteria bacterium]MDH3408286.1 FHA domain-containing protein [Gammaproteobacteria bacterium]MDH3551981.1 FHA domain-containing protein [Gammaproteobacteria bacterium]